MDYIIEVMLYCYQIVGCGEISYLNRCDIGLEKLQSEYKALIINLLKTYYFDKINMCDKNVICSMTTDSVILQINYKNNTYELKYMMFASTDKFFDDFQRIFSPDDFNLNFLVQDKKIWHDIGIEKLSIKTVKIQNQLLGCEENDLPTFGQSYLYF